MVQSDTSSRKA